MKLGRWKVYDLDIEPVGSSDNRLESYHLCKNITTEIKPVRTIRKAEDKRELLTDLVVDCVEDVNDEHYSLCVVKPTILKTYWRDNETKETSNDGEEEYAWCLSRDRYKYSPKIDFKCSAGCRNKSGAHKKTVIEWGAYQTLRKFPDKNQYWTNLNLPERDTWFFLGNMKNRRNCFIIIAVITMKKQLYIAP